MQNRVENTMALICDEKARNRKQVGKTVQVSATYISQKWNHSYITMMAIKADAVCC